jgi:tRNA threonylcarbamoyladenosine modification (KEOPS) complex Cgi121 subunit
MIYDLYIFDEVENVGDIINFLSTYVGNYKEYPMSIIDLSLVVSKFHLKYGFFYACHKFETNTMKSDFLFDEVIYCLSPSSRIHESLKIYEINPSTNQMAIIFKADEPMHESFKIFLDQFVSIIKAKVTYNNNDELFNLSIKSKDPRILKTFKLSSNEVEDGNIEKSIITRIATKHII